MITQDFRHPSIDNWAVAPITTPLEFKLVPPTSLWEALFPLDLLDCDLLDVRDIISQFIPDCHWFEIVDFGIDVQLKIHSRVNIFPTNLLFLRRKGAFRYRSYTKKHAIT